MIDYNSIIDKYYGSEPQLRGILTRHSLQVANKALEIVKDNNLDIDVDMVKTAGMLHDIGIFMTHAPSICCNGIHPYICHGVLGAELLRKEGLPESIARVAERHTGAGLSKQDIIDQHLPLPQVDYLPESLLERLICYADKFYSKSGDMKEKSLERVRASMSAHGDSALSRFDRLHNEFGKKNQYNFV